MEEKVHKIRSSFRSVFSFRNVAKSFFRTGHYSKNSGFTLVEIIVVVGILGLLITGLISLINPSLQLEKSRDSKRKSDLKQIQSALELYRADQDSYPTPRLNSVAICSGISLAYTCASPEVTYMQTVPKDPNATGNNRQYYYCTGTAPPCNVPVANGYRIYSCLENANDTDPNKLASFGVNLGCPSGSVYYYVNNP